MKQSIYFFTEEAFVNEGFTTGTITKSAMYFTKNYLYIIPYSGLKVLGVKYTNTNYTNTQEFLFHFNAEIENLSINDFHQTLKDFLPNNRIIEIISLTKFTISSNWLTAGIKLKEKERNLKTISIKSRKFLEELKAFYQL